MDLLCCIELNSSRPFEFEKSVCPESDLRMIQIYFRVGPNFAYFRIRFLHLSERVLYVAYMFTLF